MLSECCCGSGVGKLLHVNIEWSAVLSWNHVDGIIRVKSRRDSPAVNFLHWNMSDEVVDAFNILALFQYYLLLYSVICCSLR